MKYSIKDKTPSQDQFICCKKKGCNEEMVGWFNGVFDGVGQIVSGLGNIHEFDSWTDETEIKQKKPISSYNPLQHRLERKIVKCKTHGEYNAYVADDILSDCPDCLFERLSEERKQMYQEIERKKAEAKMKAVFKRSAVPPIFHGITFDHFDPPSAKAERVANILKQYVEAHERVTEQGKSILLHGNSGTGKTMLGVTILNEYMKRGYTALYMKSPAVVNWAKRAWKKDPELSQDEMIEKLLEPDIMLIDDIPKGVSSEKERQILWDVIDGRVSNLKPTVTTSLLNKDDLKERVHEEVARRITFRGISVHFDWQQYKEEGLF